MTCKVPTCKNIRRLGDPGVTFHRFPKGERFKLFKDIIGIPDLEWGPNKYICSEHFVDTDFLPHKKKIFTRDAVPSRKLFQKKVCETSNTLSPTSSLSSSPCQKKETFRNKMPGTRCAVAICTNSYEKAKKDKIPLSFHSFPKDEKLRKAWTIACTRNNSFNPSTSYICSQHFKEEDFEHDFRAKLMNIPVKRKLKKTAIPTICLLKGEGNTERQDHATKRENENITDVVVKSEFVAVPEFQEDTWEEKYVRLLQNHNVLKEEYQKLHETNKLQKMKIDKLKKCLSEVIADRNLNENNIKVIIVHDENN